MRRVYKRRQARFVETLDRELGGRIPVNRPPGGMQLSLRLPENVSAVEVSRLAAAAGIHARPLAIYSLTESPPNGLHLGYAAVPDHQIEPATKKLADAIRAAQ